MAKYQRFINDEKWKLLEPLLPKAKPSRKGGRPAIDNRQVLEGILWVLRTGARCWAYQTGQRNEVDGGGRRPRYSFGKHPCLGIALGVQAGGKTLETVKVPRNGRGRPKKRPLRLIADKGYDSDPLRKRLKAFKIDLIVPHRRNRKRPKLQDGRKLRRYRKRWKIERTFAWLGNYRRLLVRHERQIEMYQAFFHLACIMIVLNRF